MLSHAPRLLLLALFALAEACPPGSYGELGGSCTACASGTLGAGVHMDPRVCGPLRTDGGGMCSPGPVSLSCLRPGVPSGEHDARLRACWPQDIHVYQASATPNPGTTPELRVEACARGCLSRVPAVASSPYTWQGNVGIFHLRGFQIYGSGDCWCTAQRSSLCTQTLDTREQRDGSTAQRYDLVARDTRQQRNASAFSNECDRPITWPWLHRDAHGIRFLELDHALNYGDANGWNAGATTTTMAHVF